MNPDPNPVPEATPTPVDPAAPANPVPFSPTPAPAPNEPVMAQPQAAPESYAPFGGTPPIAPAQAGPIGSAPNNTVVAPSSPAPSKRKLVVIISSIVGGIILLAIVAAVVNTLFGGVSRADYQAANEQVSAVREAYSESSSAITSTTASYTATEESTQAKIDTAKTALAAFKTEHAKLSGLKAIKNDPEMKEKFAAYETKAKLYFAFCDDYLPSFEKMLVILPKDGETTAATSSATYKQKIAEYEGLGNLTDPDLKAYVASILTMLKEILPFVSEYESASTSSAKLAAANKITAAAKAGNTAGTTLTTNLNARFKDASPSDALTGLVDLTINKIRS